MSDTLHEERMSEREKRIHDFLSANRTGVLASVDPNGDPHAAVIYYTLGRRFVLSFLTKNRTKKYDNLVRNDQVLLVVFEPDSQTVAQVVGKAEEIKDGYEVNKVAADIFQTSLKTSEAGTPPIAKLHAGEYTAFRIKPVQIRMASYIRPDSGDYDKIFESVESFELNDLQD